jgi:hypothetical protein
MESVLDGAMELAVESYHAKQALPANGRTISGDARLHTYASSVELIRPSATNRRGRLTRKIAGLALSLGLGFGMAAAPSSAAAPELTSTGGIATLSRDTAGGETVTNPNEIVMYSFNALGSQMPNGGHPYERAKAGSKILLGQTDAPKADIIGFQEIRPDQKKFYSKLMPGFEVFPKDGDPQNMIMVNKKKFEVLHSGKFLYSSYGDKNLRNGTVGVWVHIRNKETGVTSTIINSRFPAWNEDPGSDPGGAEKRRHDAHIERSLAHKLDERFPNSTQFIIGDKNSTYKIRIKPQPKAPRPNKDLVCLKEKLALRDPSTHKPCLPYEVFMANPYFMSSSFDLVQGKLDHVASNIDDIQEVDWVFLEPFPKKGKVNVVKTVQLIDTDQAREATDHKLYAVTIDMKQTKTPENRLSLR